MSILADSFVDRRAPGGRWQGTVLVLVSAFAFSIAGLFTRLIETDVWTMLFWRGLFGGLLIAGYVVWRDGAMAVAALRRIGRPGLVAAGCSTAATICFINALRETSVADVLVINATAPFMTAAMAWAWTGFSERRRTLLASGVALLGVVVMVVPTLGTGRLLGNGLALAMTVLISAMMVVMRHHRDVCMLPAAALSAFLCALVVWPWADPLAVTVTDFGWLVLFGTTQFGLGQLLLTIGLRSVSATRSALIGALETPLAPALVWVVLGEVPAAMTCVGGAIVLAAVIGDLFGIPAGAKRPLLLRTDEQVPPLRLALRGFGRDDGGGSKAIALTSSTVAQGGTTVIKRKQRIPMRDLATMAAEDRATVEKNAMNGQVFNIFKVLAHHPALVKRWTPFAGHVLGKQTLPFRDRELLILRIGWLNQAEYEFAQHELIARRGGLTDDDIARLKEGPKAKGWSEHEAALLQVADDLYENSVVSDATWATLSKKYSTEQLMDAVFTVGQYNLVSWALNSFGVPLDDFLPGAGS